MLANRFIYHFRDPHRGEIIVFNTPPAAQEMCGASGTFVKRLVGLPGDTVTERDGGFVYINGKRLNEPYISPDRRAHDSTTGVVARAQGQLLLHGRQPRRVVRLPPLGIRAAQEPDRQGVRHLLAAEPHLSHREIRSTG